MGRMQVLTLGLVLMLSWAGWTSSASVDCTKAIGHWYHIFTASNELDLLSDYDHLRLYSPYFLCSNRNCDAISLGFTYRYVGYCILVSRVMEKTHGGLYQTIVSSRDILEVLDMDDSVLLLGYTYRSYSGNTYAVLALGRECKLSETDMEKFQKFLQEKGIGNQPVHFTNDDICINDKLIEEYIHAISRNDLS